MFKFIKHVGFRIYARVAAFGYWFFIAFQKWQARRFRRSHGYDPENMTLTELANHYGSDKGDKCTFAHGYTHLYEKWMNHLRQQPIRILEIGVDQGSQIEAWLSQSPNAVGDTSMASIKGLSGASLDIWKDYFPNATIHGIDIADHHHLSSGRVQVFQADQSKPEELEMIMEQSGGHYDIIIDDGSHASLHQQISFSVLFKHLKPRGMYIIEDLKIHPPFERSHLKADAQLQKTEHVCTEFLDQGRLNLAGAQDLASDALVDSIDQCTLHMETGGGIVRFTKK